MAYHKLKLTLTSKTLLPSRWLWLRTDRVLFVGGFSDDQSSLKCTSNGSLILHPCDVTGHLTNAIRKTLICSFAVL